MPRTKGAATWKVHEAEKVMRTLRNHNRFSKKDPVVKNLCKELNRPEDGVRRLWDKVKTGEHRLLKTAVGHYRLAKYIRKDKSAKGIGVGQRLKDAVKYVANPTGMLPLERHKSLIDARTEKMNNDAERMVKLAHYWGYNQAIHDLRECFKNVSDVSGEPETTQYQMKKVAKILYKKYDGKG